MAHRLADVSGSEAAHRQRRSPGENIVHGQRRLLVAGEVDLCPNVRTVGVDALERIGGFVAVPGNTQRFLSVEVDQVRSDIGIEPAPKQLFGLAWDSAT